jgi:hypothetical protein
VKNLDVDYRDENDFEWFYFDTSLGRWVHRDNHIYPWFQGAQPLVIELQKQGENGGGWFTYQVFAPKKSGSQLAGVAAFDQSSTCWASKEYHDNIYGKRWPVAWLFCPVSDPRCQRYGFTYGGGFGTGAYDYEKAVGATLRDMPRDQDAYQKKIHINPKNYEGKLGDGTRLQYATYGPDNPGWQFPAWTAPYSANPEAADWSDPEHNRIVINADELWFRYKEFPVGSGIYTPYYQTAMAEFAENNDAEGRMGLPKSLMYARDFDGLVRRGDGWRGRGVNPFSMRMDPEDNPGRPVFLNRAFQSVGELGYVLRDDPWKTLNLFWGDSADSGLLDLFCLDEGETYRPERAGVVNPNTAPKEVLTALLAGTAVHSKVVDSEPPRLDNATAASIATQIREYLGPKEEPKHVIRNISDVAEMCEEVFEGEGVAQLPSGMKDTDIGRESVARALADVCNTRTWNLFIDVVAQAGRFTAASRVPKDFVVKGERRFWVHLAIDRLSGELLDVDIEPIFE